MKFEGSATGVSALASGDKLNGASSFSGDVDHFIILNGGRSRQTLPCFQGDTDIDILAPVLKSEVSRNSCKYATVVYQDPSIPIPSNLLLRERPLGDERPLGGDCCEAYRVVATQRG